MTRVIQPIVRQVVVYLINVLSTLHVDKEGYCQLLLGDEGGMNQQQVEDTKHEYACPTVCDLQFQRWRVGIMVHVASTISVAVLLSHDPVDNT